MEAKQLAELIFRRYAGGNITADSGFRLPDFTLAVKNARAYKIRMDYFNTFRVEGERTINELWLKSYNDVPVVFDRARNIYYSVLPAQVLDLPRSLGLYHISPTQDIQTPFHPRTVGETWLFTRNPQDYITYFYDTDNVYYRNFDPSIEQVYMQLIPLDSDEIPDEFATEISELVMNQFLKPKQQVQEDKMNNQNPNITDIK